MKRSIAIILFCFLTVVGYAQQLNWTGNAGNFNFFDEQNWIETTSGAPPTSDVLSAGIAIPFSLTISGEAGQIVAIGEINLASGNLNLTSTNLKADAISGGNVILNTDAYVELASDLPFKNGVIFDLNSGLAWIKTLRYKGADILSQSINQIKVNQQPAVYRDNLRLDNYYFDGTVIRSNSTETKALMIYDQAQLQGNDALVSVNTIQNGTNIPNAMNNKMNSFLLKKGFMVTFAVNDDGTGKSKNYIASENDLVINVLPLYLQNNISFIRVIPWNWVSKKGRTKNINDLNTTWNYQWNNTDESSLEQEYAPMSWGAGGANDDADIALYLSKYKSTHVMAFNESDNCNDQSGQFNNLCDTDVAVGFYKNLMKTGLRLVSPSTRENGPFGWLKEFHDKATAQDVRIDVIGVHWYDWGSNPSTSPNANPTDVFNRFKKYLQDVYDLYKLPIWISEFNANPNRSTATNLGFMKLALPYLETLDFVERYNWFEPSSVTANFFDPTNNLTEVGNFYKNQISTASIADAVITADNNLDIFFEKTNNLFVNGDFETGNLNGWSGTNTGIITGAEVFEGTTSGRILANSGSLSQSIQVESNTNYNVSFYTKWFVTPSAPIEVQIRNSINNEVIASKLMTTQTVWNLIELDFSVPPNVNSITFIVQKGNSPGWFIDNAVMIKTQTLSLSKLERTTGFIYPNPSTGVFNIIDDKPINSLQVFNLQGQLILSDTPLTNKIIQINLSKRVRGIYLMAINYADGTRKATKLILN